MEKRFLIIDFQLTNAKAMSFRFVGGKKCKKRFHCLGVVLLDRMMHVHRHAFYVCFAFSSDLTVVMLLVHIHRAGAMGRRQTRHFHLIKLDFILPTFWSKPFHQNFIHVEPLR